MLTYTVAFLLAAVTAFVLTPLVRWAAHRFGLVDSGIEARKVHDKPIPRLGGVAIVVAFFVPILGLFFIDNAVSAAYTNDVWHVAGLVGGAGLTVALGLADDLANLSAKVKLLAQVGIAVGVYYLGYDIAHIATPFGFNIMLGWLSLPVTVLWIVGVMNAINLIDGLDGLASGVSLFTVLTLFVLALISGNLVVGLTSAALAGALIGFLRYNFNPASIFMGDSGSLFLGFVLAVTAISGSAKSSTIVALMIPLLALGLPLFDTGMAIVRRFSSGKPIFSADRGHVHHRLLDLGLSHRQVVLALYGVCLVFTLLALSLVYANNVMSGIVLGVFLVAVVVFAKTVGLLDMNEFNAGLKYGLFRQQRAKVHLVAIEACVAAIARAKSNADLLSALETLGEDVRLDEIRLNVAIAGTGSLAPVDFDWMREPTDIDASGPAATPPPMQQLEHQLDWTLGHVDLVGRIAFAWHCEEGVLQIPEAPGYHLVGLAVRDRLLQLAVEASAVPVGPRLVSR